MRRGCMLAHPFRPFVLRAPNQVVTTRPAMRPFRAAKDQNKILRDVHQGALAEGYTCWDVQKPKRSQSTIYKKKTNLSGPNSTCTTNILTFFPHRIYPEKICNQLSRIHIYCDTEFPFIHCDFYLYNAHC